MATIQSITNSYQDPYPTVSLQQKSPCGTATTTFWTAGLTGSIPSSVNIDYTPSRQTVLKRDPSSDLPRNWPKIIKSGQISMTPYFASQETEHNYPASRDRKFYEWRRAYLTCGSTCTAKWGMNKYGYGWTENFTLRELSLILDHYSLQNPAEYEEQIQDAIATTQTAAYADSLSSYDVLTQVAEARETLEFVQSKVGEAARLLNRLAHEDETTWKRARSDLKTNARRLRQSTDKAFNKLGGRWMEYRYALMPLIYAIGDVNDLIKQRNALYQTDRARASIQIDTNAIPTPAPTRFLYDSFSGTAVVRSTVKTGYNSFALQRVLSNIGINPFVTGWELIPFSFVIDWFINVGDNIKAQTSVDLSSQKVGCTSIRRTWTRTTHYWDFTSDYSERSVVANTCFPAATFSELFQRSINVPVRDITHDSYERKVWSNPTTGLVYDPSINWKRTLDGIVLSYSTIRKLLRSL